jgi:membrane protein insertase Oxa1/YidC/SpoIIIJ
MMTQADRTYHEASEPIKCALVNKPTEAEKHTKEMMRYMLVMIALLAVLLLIAIALYYTQGNSFTVKHVRLHVPHVPLVHLT